VTLASVAAMRIRNVALSEEAAERRRLEWELKQARRIQVGLFPEKLPEFEGYDLFAGNIPSQGVSGDYYEVSERADGTECVLLVADVAGKGMSASLLTGCLDALTSVPIEAGLDPHEVFQQISGKFHRRTPNNRFATVFLAVLDRDAGTIRYANAGHNPGLIIRQGGATEELNATGLPLGMVSDAEYTLKHTSLDPGDLMILYTDGYTEAANESLEEFGAERLAASCTDTKADALDKIAKAIEGDLARFTDGCTISDDRTLVLVRRSSE
jgi:sigma-B regulation protein RsbU (phosphoserine phosphatase)